MGIFNLHNHTRFSDGVFSIDQLCEAHLALRAVQVDGIGVSDHVFCTPSSREPRDDREFERVFGDETRDYIAEVRAAREQWADRIKVFVGCEIDWQRNKARLDVIREQFASGFDYVLFEGVDWAGVTQLANQARRWPCSIGIADTDIAEQFPNTSMDQVVRTLANARMFYEINSRFLPLPNNHPWMTLLPAHRVSVSLGTDTHDDFGCLERLADLERCVERFGLCDRLWAPRAPRGVGAAAESASSR